MIIPIEKGLPLSTDRTAADWERLRKLAGWTDVFLGVDPAVGAGPEDTSGEYVGDFTEPPKPKHKGAIADDFAAIKARMRDIEGR